MLHVVVLEKYKEERLNVKFEAFSWALFFGKIKIKIKMKPWFNYLVVFR